MKRIDKYVSIKEIYDVLKNEIARLEYRLLSTIQKLYSMVLNIVIFLIRNGVKWFEINMRKLTYPFEMFLPFESLQYNICSILIQSYIALLVTLPHLNISSLKFEYFNYFKPICLLMFKWNNLSRCCHYRDPQRTDLHVQSNFIYTKNYLHYKMSTSLPPKLVA